MQNPFYVMQTETPRIEEAFNGLIEAIFIEWKS